MSETKRKAIRLLRKYDKMRMELHALERELTKAVRAYADEERLLGWYDKDKFRVSLIVQEEMKLRTKRKAA